MNLQEFEALRDLPGKRIDSDIRFTPSKELKASLTFDNIEVANELGHDLVLNGSYTPRIPSLKFNFVVRGVGPICRVEVNGVVHKPAGRTHKHDLQDENCPRLNLPTAHARPDLDLSQQTPSQIWAIICAEARIGHEGTFIEPK